MGDELAGKRLLAKLSATRVKSLKDPGTYEDGGGLRLVVSASGAKRWVMRVSVAGKRREYGLGGYPTVTLEEARHKAHEIRRGATSGRDLLAEKRESQRRNVTFQEAFDAFFSNKRNALTNAKHLAQWPSTMKRYVFPVIGSRPVADVSSAEIIQVLSPIWYDKAETARRVLQRMEAVFKSAILRGQRLKASPCIGVAQELGVSHRKPKHHRFMPYGDVPGFVSCLRQVAGRPATRLAFEWLIFTACRSGEVRGARWCEIDEADAVWRIPAARMKNRRDHTIPLPPRCLEILRQARDLYATSDLIFPGAVAGSPMSDMTLTELLRRMGVADQLTVHGFRTSFKTWCAEVAKVQDEVSEAALGHVVHGKVRAAYLRTDFLAERRVLMNSWASFVCAEQSMNDTTLKSQSFRDCKGEIPPHIWRGNTQGGVCMYPETKDLAALIEACVERAVSKALGGGALNAVSNVVRTDLNMSEVMTLLGESRSQIYRRIKKGEISRFKVGSRLRFKRDEVRTLVERPRTGPI